MGASCCKCKKSPVEAIRLEEQEFDTTIKYIRKHQPSDERPTIEDEPLNNILRSVVNKLLEVDYWFLAMWQFIEYDGQTGPAEKVQQAKAQIMANIQTIMKQTVHRKIGNPFWIPLEDVRKPIIEDVWKKDVRNKKEPYTLILYVLDLIAKVNGQIDLIIVNYADRRGDVNILNALHSVKEKNEQIMASFNKTCFKGYK